MNKEIENTQYSKGFLGVQQGWPPSGSFALKGTTHPKARWPSGLRRYVRELLNNIIFMIP